MPEPQLVDPYGRPVSTAALLAEQPIRRSRTAPPTFNPEPEKLKTIFKLADAGDPRQLQQLAGDLEQRDGHFGGVLETRRRAVTRLHWRAVAETDDKLAVDIVDAVQRDILGAPFFRPMCRALLDAVVKAWSVCSIQWVTGDVWRPAAVRWVDQQMTGCLPDDERIAWRDPGDETKLVPIEPYTALVHVASDPSGPIYRRGIGRSLAMLYSLKRLGLTAWAAFIELFGVARPVVSYPPGAKQSDVDEYEARIQQWMHGGYMVKPASLTVAFPEPANTRASGGGGEPVQAGLARWCDEQASKRIIGQTMTSDSGSSLSQAQVHMQVAAWILEADAADLAETITRDLVVPYVQLNFGPDAPVPVIGAIIEDGARRQAQLTAIEKMAPLGLRVEQSVVRDLIGLPEPAEGAELLEEPAAVGDFSLGGFSFEALSKLPPHLQARFVDHLAAREGRPERAEVDPAGVVGEAFARQLRAAQAARGAGAAAGPLRSAQLRADDARRRRGGGAPGPARLAAEDDEDLVDRDAGAAAEAYWRRNLQPFVAAVEDAAAAADTYSEFKKRLRQATVDGDVLVRDLATTDMQLRGVGDGTDDT